MSVLQVLVVEDSEDLRELLGDIVQELGHHVHSAKDGVEGLERLLALKPDVAFVDVGLPKLDGFELARRARSSAAGKGLYLVALTGHGGDEAKKKAQGAGFDLHLTKPLDLEVLEKLLTARATGAKPA
ncbi:MAG: response regulator [Myxococcaceae bacterium]|nr:response regulator [Myxococcaceae bacterium]